MSSSANILDVLDDPNFDVDRVKSVAYGLGLPLLILWAVLVPMCLFGLTKCCKQTLRDRKYLTQSPPVIILMFLWLIVEFFQINWFSFVVDLGPWPGSNLVVVLDAFLLHFDIGWFAWYWIFAGLGLGLVGLALLVMACCEGDDGVAAMSIFVLVTPVFQPMMVRMMEALACTYPIGQEPFLDVVPDMLCWQGIHLLYAIISVLMIIIYYPAIAIFLSVILAGSSTRTLWLGFIAVQVKMLQVFIITFIPGFPMPALLTMLAINSTLFLLSLSMPSDNRWANLVRSTLMFMCVWATVSVLIQFGVNDPNNWAATGVLIAGWVILPIAFFLLRRHWLQTKEKRERRAARQQDLEKATAMPMVAPMPVPVAPPLPGPTYEIHLNQMQASPTGGGMPIIANAVPVSPGPQQQYLYPPSTVAGVQVQQAYPRASMDGGGSQRNSVNYGVQGGPQPAYPID